MRKRKQRNIICIILVIIAVILIGGVTGYLLTSKHENEAKNEAVADPTNTTSEEQDVDPAKAAYDFMESIGGTYDDEEIEMHSINVGHDNNFDYYSIIGNGFYPIDSNECIDVNHDNGHINYIFKDSDGDYYRVTVEDDDYVGIFYGDSADSCNDVCGRFRCPGLLAGTQGQIQEIEDVSFETLSNFEFWNYNESSSYLRDDSFKIENDGFFHGKYSAFDKSSTEEEYEYPRGHSFVCEYSGHLADLKKIDDYTYSANIADISIDNENDSEYNFDGQLRSPCGLGALADCKTLYIYLPGKKVSELDEMTVDFINHSYANVDTYMNKEKLKKIILVNDSEGDYYFLPSDRPSYKDEAQSLYDSAVKKYDEVGDRALSGITSDMVIASGNQYQVADDCLNELWILIKYHVPEDQYEEILKEQKAWISEKEKTADEAAAGYGSFATVSYNDVCATKTLERCKELLEYLK